MVGDEISSSLADFVTLDGKRGSKVCEVAFSELSLPESCLSPATCSAAGVTIGTTAADFGTEIDISRSITRNVPTAAEGSAPAMTMSARCELF